MNDFNEFKEALSHSAIVINKGESVIEHANHKYINKFMRGGKWVYEYAEDKASGARDAVSDAARRAGKEISDTAYATANHKELQKKVNFDRGQADYTRRKMNSASNHDEYSTARELHEEAKRSGAEHQTMLDKSLQERTNRAKDWIKNRTKRR